eukprot:13834717-Ditylum_brightwellii.AAC.1
MPVRPPNAIQNKQQHSVTDSVAPEQNSCRPQLIRLGTKSRPSPPNPHPHLPHIKHRPSARQQSLCHLPRKTCRTRSLGSLYIVTPPIGFTQTIIESINDHL